MFTVTSVHAVIALMRDSFFGQSFIMIVTRQSSVKLFTANRCILFVLIRFSLA